MELRVITTPEQHSEALAELRSLMERDPKRGTAESDRLQVLALLIETFEREHFPIPAPSPIDAIRFRMEEMGLAARDLEPFVGSRSKVSEVLSGRTPLSLRMIRELSRGLNIPVAVLLNTPVEEQTEPSPDQIERLPLKELARRGWITATASEIRRNATGIARAFLREAGSPIYSHAFRRTLHRRTSTPSESPTVTAWLARAHILANRSPALPAFDKASITTDFLRELIQLSTQPSGPKLARERLRDKGILVVVVPTLPRLRADGAAFRTEKGTPVIALTLRHDRIDNFWFTLAHEIAHILNHLDLQSSMFIDDLELLTTRDPLEAEADAFARDVLIPRGIWAHSDALHDRTPQAIVSLAAQLNIHPAIVAGRLRRETKRFTEFGQLVGHHQVRVLFADEWI